MSCRTTACCHWLSTFWLLLKRSFILSLVGLISATAAETSVHTPGLSEGSPHQTQSHYPHLISAISIVQLGPLWRSPRSAAAAHWPETVTEPSLSTCQLALFLTTAAIRSLQTEGASGVTDDTVSCRCQRVQRYEGFLCALIYWWLVNNPDRGC